MTAILHSVEVLGSEKAGCLARWRTRLRGSSISAGMAARPRRAQRSPPPSTERSPRNQTSISLTACTHQSSSSCLSHVSDLLAATSTVRSSMYMGSLLFGLLCFAHIGTIHHDDAARQSTKRTSALGGPNRRQSATQSDFLLPWVQRSKENPTLGPFLILHFACSPLSLRNNMVPYFIL
jgi:hypothetical protein